MFYHSKTVKTIFFVCVVLYQYLSAELLISEKVKNFLEGKRIVLIKESQHVTPEELMKNYPNKIIVVCDFYVDDIEKSPEIDGGYFYANGDQCLINIDHHAPVERMAKEVTATSCAIDYVSKYGAIEDKTVVIINHTDCDSILSSLIMTGVLLPQEEYRVAAHSADHSGKENKIADLLQALQSKRDVFFSVQNLEKLLNDKNVDEQALVLRNNRYEDRALAKSLVDEGAIKTDGIVSYAYTTKKIDAGLLPAYLPRAQIIMLYTPMPTDPSRIIYSLRRGLAALNGIFLNKLDLAPEFGGRWNAIANRRGGGSTIKPEECIRKINEQIKKQILI